jgi:hypothetical protein
MWETLRWNPSLSPGQTLELEDDRGMGGHRRSLNLSIMTSNRGTFIRLTDDEALDLAEALRDFVQDER